MLEGLVLVKWKVQGVLTSRGLTALTFVGDSHEKLC